MFLDGVVVTVLVMTNHKATFDNYEELLEDPHLFIEQLESLTILLNRLNDMQGERVDAKLRVIN